MVMDSTVHLVLGVQYKVVYFVVSTIKTSQRYPHPKSMSTSRDTAKVIWVADRLSHSGADLEIQI